MPITIDRQTQTDNETSQTDTDMGSNPSPRPSISGIATTIGSIFDMLSNCPCQEITDVASSIILVGS